MTPPLGRERFLVQRVGDDWLVTVPAWARSGGLVWHRRPTFDQAIALVSEYLRVFDRRISSPWPASIDR